MKVENADTYTITNVSRDTTGEYKCSLTDDPTMEASQDISVKCKSTINTCWVKNKNYCNFAAQNHHCHSNLVAMKTKSLLKKKVLISLFTRVPTVCCQRFVEKTVVSTTLWAVSQLQGCMVNNRNVSILVRPLNHPRHSFRPRHQFEPLWKYHQECRWNLGSDSPDWCFGSHKGLMDKGRNFNQKTLKSMETSQYLWFTGHIFFSFTSG